MKRKAKIYTILLALASLLLFAVQPVWAVGSISAVNAYNNAKAGNGVIIDVRTVEEHNKCQPPWAGTTCPNPEAANNGSPMWTDDATGAVVLPPNIPFWISSTASDTQPEDTTEYRNAFQALLDAGYITKSTPLYLICRSGYRSYYGALWIEKNMGFTNVYTLDSDGLGGADGGMLEWTAKGLPKNEQWKPAQVYSISPVDGFTESSTDTVTFSVGILEPTWGNVKLGIPGWVGYRAVNSVDLFVDGTNVASDTTDTTAGKLWSVYSFTQTLSNGSHTWNAKVTTEPWTNSVDVSWSDYALAAGPGDRTVTVSTAVSEPNISVTPASKDFGSVVVGNSSATQTFTVSNTGSAPLSVGSVTISGDFTITSDSCSGVSLDPSASCAVGVVFTPSTVGTLTGTLSITSDDPDTPTVEVALSGTGVSETVTGPNISVSPTTVDFGNVVVGTTSAPQTVTVANTGNADLTVSNVVLTGDTDFDVQTTTCVDPILAPGESCSADVVFTPSSIGGKTATVTITSDDPDTPTVEVTLTGNGVVEEPDITVSPTSVDFGSVAVGSSDSKTVTVKNDGTADLNITSVSTLSGPFSTTDGCTGQTLAPAASCTVTIDFAPTAAGTYSDSFVISSDDPDESSVTVNVSGEGAQVSANQPPTKPVLLYPENGATDLPTDNVPLVWKKSTDPDGDAITYVVKYCADDPSLRSNCKTKTVDDTTAAAKVSDRPMYAGLGAGAGLLLFGIVLAGSARRRKLALLIGMMVLTAMFLVSCGDDVTTDNTTGTVISGLDTRTTYYWQVTASDGQSQTSSDVWSFTTETGGKRKGRH